MAAGHYRDVESDFQVNLHPPTENTQEVESSLDALLQAEIARAKVADADSAQTKQRMLVTERASIKQIVDDALAPLLGQESASFLQAHVTSSSKHTDAQINLTPPSESTGDSEQNLDNLLSAEMAKDSASDEEIAAAKQRLLSLEKDAIRRLVAHAFAA